MSASATQQLLALLAQDDADRGVNLTLCRRYVDAGAGRNQDGSWHPTPMVLAAEKGNVQVVEWLLEKGAPVNNYDDNRRTALMGAAMFGKADVMHLLIERGAYIDLVDRARQTALTMAAMFGHTAACVLLVENGADAAFRTDVGKAGHLATVQGHPETAKAIKIAKTKPGRRKPTQPDRQFLQHFHSPGPPPPAMGTSTPPLLEKAETVRNNDRETKPTPTADMDRQSNSVQPTVDARRDWWQFWK